MEEILYNPPGMFLKSCKIMGINYHLLAWWRWTPDFWLPSPQKFVSPHPTDLTWPPGHWQCEARRNAACTHVPPGSSDGDQLTPPGWLGLQEGNFWNYRSLYMGVNPKMVGFPNNQGFPTENDHFRVFWGYHHLVLNVEIMLNWVVVSNIFYVHPENWGRWTQFDEHIFHMGWNHQLVIYLGIDMTWYNIQWLFSWLQ